MDFIIIIYKTARDKFNKFKNKAHNHILGRMII